MPHFHSQREDRRTVERLKSLKRGGLVDVGAHDGVADRNAHDVEQLGWTGSCIAASRI